MNLRHSIACSACALLAVACSTSATPKVQGTSESLPSTSTSTTVAVPTTPDSTTLPIPTTLPTTTWRPAPRTTPPPPPEDPPPAEPVNTVADILAVSLDDPDMPTWRAIALCEMPGPGGVPSEPWGAHWGFIGSRFSGAYGIANSTWRAFGGTEFGPTAGHATWQQQTIVARRIRDRHGYRAWGCGR